MSSLQRNYAAAAAAAVSSPEEDGSQSSAEALRRPLSQRQPQTTQDITAGRVPGNTASSPLSSPAERVIRVDESESSELERMKEELEKAHKLLKDKEAELNKETPEAKRLRKQRRKSEKKLKSYVKFMNDELEVIIDSVQRSREQPVTTQGTEASVGEGVRVSDLGSGSGLTIPNVSKKEKVQQFFKCKFDRLSELVREREKSVQNTTAMKFATVISQLAKNKRMKTGAGSSAPSVSTQSSSGAMGEAETTGSGSSSTIFTSGTAEGTSSRTLTPPPEVDRSSNEGANGLHSIAIQLRMDAPSSESHSPPQASGSKSQPPPQPQPCCSKSLFPPQASTSKSQDQPQVSTPSSSSQAQQRTTPQEMEEDDSDDDCVIVEPDSEHGQEADAPTSPSQIETPDSNQPISLYTIKVEPGKPFQPPRKRHTRDVTKRGWGAYYCTCGIKFASRKKLAPHIKFWKGGYRNYHWSPRNAAPSFLPKNCPKTSKPRSSVSDADKKFACDWCSKRFIGVSLLKLHTKRVHGIDVGTPFDIGCRTCGLVVSSRVEFSHHLKIAHKKNYGHGFGQRLALTSVPGGIPATAAGSTPPVPSTSAQHQQNAGQERGGRQQHGVVKDRPAILGVYCKCGLRFQTLFRLELHIRAQKKCRVCGIGYMTDTGLKQHMKKAHKKRPHECSCGKGYQHPAMLRKHLDAHTHIKILSCPTCGKRFYKEDKFKLHLKKDHPKNNK